MDKRVGILSVLAVLILCSAAFAQTAPRPETGTYIRDTDRSGYGVLTIHNDWTMDTVAVLTDDGVKPLVAVYLRSKDALELDFPTTRTYVGNNFPIRLDICEYKYLPATFTGLQLPQR